MTKLYQKSITLFAIGWIALYVVLFSVADGLSQSIGVEKLITLPTGLVLSGLLLGFLRKNGLMEQYGLCRFSGKLRDYLYFLPLVVLVSIQFWNGVTCNLRPVETVLFLLSMLTVGFLEEIIFRGLLFEACKDMGLCWAILISSVTFGLGHIVNLLNGAPVTDALLQLCYATAIGFLFTLLFYRGKSLIPCIVTHGLFNALSVFSVEPGDDFKRVVALVICVLSVGYALWILRQTKVNA